MSPWSRIFLPYAAGYFLSYLLRNANAVIAPELSRELGISASGLGLLPSVLRRLWKRARGLLGGT